MADTARVVFLAFRSSSDPMSLAWNRFRESVAVASDLAPALAQSGAAAPGVSAPGAAAPGVNAPGLAAPSTAPSAAAKVRRADPTRETRPAGRSTPAGSTGVWRILATNNRELCRAAHVYPSFGRAHGHVLRLRERLDELVVVPVVGPRPGSRGWYMTLGGVVVVTCGRWYGSTASSAEAAEASLEALRTAVIADAARELTPAPRSARLPAGAELASW